TVPSEGKTAGEFSRVGGTPLLVSIKPEDMVLLLVREGRGSLLIGLLRPKRPTFEFPFRLEPIVQVPAVFSAAFNVELVCATSDFRVKLQVSPGARCSLFSARGFCRLKWTPGVRHEVKGVIAVRWKSVDGEATVDPL